jgi:protease I
VLLSLHDRVIPARSNDLVEAAGTFDVNALVSAASVEDCDALLLPGGTVNPDKRRIDQAAVGFCGDVVAGGCESDGLTV